MATDEGNYGIGTPLLIAEVCNVEVWAWDGNGFIDIETSRTTDEGMSRMTSTEAIAAARAILAHFGE